MYKLCFFVPESHVEPVKKALFDLGAGKIGLYDCCSWQVLGDGQFRALSGANPFLGSLHEIEKVAEYKVEMVVEDSLINEVVKTLIHFHPYEEPAYEVYNLIDIDT